ncbi:Bug family tripartite tricarboxylate transporter substrate binding protein [Bordetella sp. 02P26C-1]|uniref:Bug family tripartite tricarboxylate transporter substrate binding protein n=1 Tax=Bordetella sp. 02P26C-1 TaxID=2683195 RepID=UPI0013550CCE|nr:tripartite tricarboxylate transporter substrate binding protein [Bordetella sp. 02P26C-1]MVW77562.1 tripartite tricarboxylate transporter substrate binding protein [Bordetella sp. 02P26C-1]
MNTSYRATRRILLSTLTLAVASAATPVWAQSPDVSNYPSKPITLIVPFAAGSVTDILARIVGQRLGDSLGQSVIVENKAGADGNIGAGYAAAAAPDGYTIMMGPASTNAINPSLHKGLKFNAMKDFAPITNVASMPNVLVVGPEVPVKNVPEFIEAAKKGDYSFASSGAGGSMHLSGELFKNTAKIPEFLHVPYKGGSAPVTDVMAGRVTSMFCNLPLCLPHIQAGKLRALAVTSSTRTPLLPDVPTMEEAGLPGYDVSGWFGLFAPTGVPKPIIQKLNKEVVQILQDPKVKQQLLAQGAEPIGDSPEDFGAFVQKEHARWAKVIQDAGITPQ